MKTHLNDFGEIVEVPNFFTEAPEDDSDKCIITITEGEFKDVHFGISNVGFDFDDEGNDVLAYVLSVAEDVDLERLKPVVSNIILNVIQTHIDDLEKASLH